MKNCTKCNNTKEINNFHKDKSKKDGYNHWCKECSNKKHKDYYYKNRAQCIKKDIEYQNKRAKTDPIFAEIKKARQKIKDLLRHNGFKAKNAYTQCTGSELKAHLESKFKPGMSWENKNQWHVDHIIPLSCASSKQEVEKLCHYTNLQPLWSNDNIRKSNK